MILSFLTFAAIQPAEAARVIWWIITGTAISASIGGVIWSVCMVYAFRRDLRRDREGLCMACGYDIRHAKDRCPECGTEIRNRKFQSS